MDTSRGKCILIVEDEEIVRKILDMQLKSFGYKTFAAILPEEGLAWFRENYDNIDLVLLDMNMPQMDGLETFRKMKEIDPDVRVLVLSGYSQHGKIEAAISEGVIGYMTKPVRKAALAEKIKGILYSSTPVQKKPVKDDCECYEFEPVFNEAFFNGQFEAAPGLKKKVLDSFLNNAPALCNDLDKAVDSGDLEAIEVNAHKTYGPISSLGGDQAGSYAKAIELAAQAGEPGKIEIYLKGFHKAFQELTERLESLESL